MNKKITYSKLLPIVTGAVFIFTLLYCLLFGSDYSSTILVTALTASAGAFTGTCVWYMKKAQSENMYKLKIALFDHEYNNELDYLEKVIVLKQKYNVSDLEINEIKANSIIDDLKDDAFRSINGSIDSLMEDANTPTEMY